MLLFRLTISSFLFTKEMTPYISAHVQRNEGCEKISIVLGNSGVDSRIYENQSTASYNRSTTAFRILAQLASLLNIIPGNFILSALVSPMLHIAIGY
jgi:hypothetical protein